MRCTLMKIILKSQQVACDLLFSIPLEQQIIIDAPVIVTFEVTFYSKVAAL